MSMRTLNWSSSRDTMSVIPADSARERRALRPESLPMSLFTPLLSMRTSVLLNVRVASVASEWRRMFVVASRTSHAHSSR